MWGDGSATKSLAVLAEDLSSVPNTHQIAACDSRSRGSNALCWPQQAPLSFVYIPPYRYTIHRSKISY